MQDMLGLPVRGARRRTREGVRKGRQGYRTDTDADAWHRVQFTPTVFTVSVAIDFIQRQDLCKCCRCLTTTSLVGLNIFFCLATFLSFFFFILFCYCCCFSVVLAEHVWKFPMSSSIASARDASTFLWTRAAATKSCLHATCILKVGQDNYNLVRFKSDFSEVSRVSTQV